MELTAGASRAGFPDFVHALAARPSRGEGVFGPGTPPSVRYSHGVRLPAAQRLLAAILATWMPLSCCCQAMALARTAVAAIAASDDRGEREAPSCCSGHDADDHDGQAEDGGADDHRAPPPCDDCPACASAKGKAPLTTPPTIDRDDVGREVAWLPEIDAAAPACERAAPTGIRPWSGADPPWRPAGRTVLAKHARLVI